MDDANDVIPCRALVVRIEIKWLFINDSVGHGVIGAT
jgi:hypothetical protein